MTRAVALRGGGQTMLLAVRRVGMPTVLGWGDLPPDRASGATLALGVASLRINGMDEPVPDAVLLPTGGLGRFGWPAIQGHREGGDWTVEFGDWQIEERPAALALRGADDVAGLAIAIHLAVSDAAVFTMRVELTNVGDTGYALDRCMAGTMLADDRAGRVSAFEGGWGREFHLASEVLGQGAWLQESRRGRTSHDRHPTVFLSPDGDPSGQAGPCYGLHLGWSGNHVLCVERLEDGRRLVHAGELFEPGEMRLAPGETYRSPVAALACGNSMGVVAAAFRAHVRRHLLTWPGGSMTARPVTLNTWEANTFRHNPQALMDQASAAAALGVERFVLDDGWFGRRDSDSSSLGDWRVDACKYPDGLGPLVRHVIGLGMQFGLWFEPEMVSPDSDLYRAHPEWVLRVDGRPLQRSRHQLVLDLSRPGVSDHLFDQMHAVLSEHAVSAIKWDMNRDLTAAGGVDGRAATSRQTRAVYALMDRIRQAHPAVEIESCASGGGRADYGALARTHRVWLSDCTDALERLSIQAGASLFLPPEIVGAHVSAAPGHQTRRRHTLSFRAVVALAYHFGVELDPLALDAVERAELGAWIALHKRLRPVLHGVDSLLFRQPVTDGRHVYGAIAASTIVVIVAQGAQPLRQQADRIRVAGADPARLWRVAAVHPAKPPLVRVTSEQGFVLSGGTAFSAEDLAGVGLPVPALYPESGLVIELEAEGSHG